VRSHGHWLFEPARRWRSGRRPLVWQGPHAPEHGDYCIAEVPWGESTATLVEVLGAEDRPAWDDAAVASQSRLRIHFPRPAIHEAAGHREPGAAERRGREDLRAERSYTIDPEDARDHDDALSCRRLEGGRFQVGIHIADVTHYVTEGGLLDREARARGTSTYLPGGVVPMLPERLSADLCSLRPLTDRLTLSLLAELDANGRVHGYRLAEAVIHSRHRLSYEEVQEFLEGRRDLEPELAESLMTLRHLARELRAQRMRRGALDLDVPEVKAWVDEQGVPLRLERRPHLESHEIVEEFMLLANRAVGEQGARREAGLLYRVHEAPKPAKLAELDVMLRALGLPRLGGQQDPAAALQALLKVALPDPMRRLVHRLVLRSLARARYLERDLGHFGLAAREYVHFTSPIRRYPDLHNHRQVKRWLHRGRSGAARDVVELAELAERCSGAEQTATEAERQGVKVKALRVLETRLGDEASGIISGLVPRGFFVELDDSPLEGFVNVSREFDDVFVLEPSGVRMVGRRTRRRFSLGDAVRVTIARVDVPARECDMALVEQRRRRESRH
jgi:ribonuclease R